MSMSKNPLLLGVVVLLLNAGTVFGDVFKCSDSKGNVSYQDLPCVNGVVRRDLQQRAPTGQEATGARDGITRMNEASRRKEEAKRTEREQSIQETEDADEEE